MLLSIGMIVKNEDKYLDRCLTVLKPILDNVDSELIIADTGSTDRTVEIAKKYTDRVLYYEWIKDFSAARNFTLENSKGEWFMFIDADEILVSCDEIIEFFNSGEYKQYRTATYIQRNYSNAELTDYSDFNASRLTRIAPGIRFVNPIHEAISPFYAPVKFLSTVADHYGHIFENEELKRQKFERNSALLLESLNKSADTDMMLYLQLYQSFILYDDEKALYYMNCGIEKCKEKKHTVLIPLYAEKAAFLYNKGRWQDILDLSDEYFHMDTAIRSGTISTDAEIFAFKAMAEYRLEMNNEAIDDFVEFFKLYADFAEGKLITSEVIMFSFNLAKPAYMSMLLYNFLNACISEKRFSAAMQVLKAPVLADCYKNQEYTKALLEQEFIIMHSTEYKRAKALYSQLDDYGKGWYKAIARYDIESAENKSAPIEAFRKACKEDEGFCCFLSAAYAHYFKADSSAEIAEMIKFGCFDYFELLYFMLSEQQDISPLIASGKFDIAEGLISCADRFSDMLAVLDNYSPDKIGSTRTFLSFCEAAMLLSLQKQRDIEALFSLWGKAASEESIDENDGQLYAAAMANVILNSWHNGDIKTCIGAMSAAVKKYPQSKPFILAIRDKVQQSVSAPKPNNEMEALAAAVKNNIRSLISSGKTEEAKRVFEEYLKINPNDPDNEKLKYELNERQKS